MTGVFCSLGLSETTSKSRSVPSLSDDQKHSPMTIGSSAADGKGTSFCIGGHCRLERH